ncbi:lasso peptide biosynthesis PqqD family chaperone [Robertmurraya sp. FSL R5-0851]|uniref:lasso peptide biosynthesis PqqD family chaperone n=1 Tax=Robertmurraya sp. FSL R5-0851 TaxID=2921584 RepID=UPI0030F5507D
MKILNNITIDSTISQVPGNVVSNMNGEVVMLNIDNGKYYNLGEIGGIIWKKIGSSITLHKLVSDLLEEFDISKNECEQHVLEFIGSLQAENLVTVKQG